MKMIISTLIAISAFAGAAVAAPPSPSPSAAAKTLACPACKMPMPTKKTGMFTVPVKIKGVTYYCCSACPAGKEAAKKAAPATKSSATPSVKPAAK